MSLPMILRIPMAILVSASPVVSQINLDFGVFCFDYFFIFLFSKILLG